MCNKSVTLLIIGSIKDNPLLLWIPLVDTYVEEMLRLEGPGNAFDQVTCAGCKLVLKDAAYHRCHDCFDTYLWCTDCLVERHRNHPFHRIQVGDYVY